MAKSHVYYHFSGRQQIFDDLVDARIGEILADEDALFAQLGDLPGLDAEAISTIVRRGVDELIRPARGLLAGRAGREPGHRCPRTTTGRRF